MSKKHFELIAHYISTMLDSHCKLNAAVAVASACKVANPKFDEQKFFKACGVQRSTVKNHFAILLKLCKTTQTGSKKKVP